jgi:hypothetical protein
MSEFELEVARKERLWDTDYRYLAAIAMSWPIAEVRMKLLGALWGCGL